MAEPAPIPHPLPPAAEARAMTGPAAEAAAEAAAAAAVAQGDLPADPPPSLPPVAPAGAEPLHLAGLLSGGWRQAPFAPFREGVEICRLWSGPPDAALLRYAPGASVPRHAHGGLETVMVLDGGQSDERGHYPAGSVVLNPEGSIHRVWSDEGCVVLILWERPVIFLEG